MLKHRVIPCLLVKGNGLVKTQKFCEPKYVGDPINAIRIFNEKSVDELIVLDIEASKQHREPNCRLIEQFAGECFMPLCYGGGIRTVEQAKRIFALGVEKISVQTSVLADVNLICSLADSFGSQSIVVSIDIKKNILGQYKLYSCANNNIIPHNWKKHLVSVINAGAGEVLINAVDNDGMMNGMDFNLIKAARTICNIPLIAMGGVGSLEDIKLAIKSGADAVAAGAFFVYHGPHRAVLITYPKYFELEAIEEF